MDNLEMGEITSRNLARLMKACKLTNATLVASREDEKVILLEKLDPGDPDPIIQTVTRALKTGLSEKAKNVDEIIFVNKPNQS